MSVNSISINFEVDPYVYAHESLLYVCLCIYNTLQDFCFLQVRRSDMLSELCVEKAVVDKIMQKIK